MRITVLGTSSATPTFKRSLSGTLLEYEGEGFLFDCGEGTQFQLMKAGARRGRLNTILITHLHGDHYFGLPGLLSSLGLNQRDTGLKIIGPEGLKRYVDFVLGFPKRFSLPFPIEVQELPPGFEGVVHETEHVRIVSAPLEHRLPTHGYRFEEKPRAGSFDAARADELGVPFGPERGRLIRGETIELADGRLVKPEDLVGPPRAGRSFAYCTDTTLCLGAKRLAEEVDLLLHETTYGEEFYQLADERKHCTMRQAAVLARASRAKTFIATHFSTRYDREKLKEIEAEGRAIVPDLIMAVDLMCVEI